MRRALVSSTRVPEIDRDSGSQQVDLYVRWLLEAGWSVSFVARDRDGDEHHAHRLRRAGVATYVGFDDVEELLAAQRFDVAVLAYWEPASVLVPLIRAACPATRILVDSVDVHFLREARRSLNADAPLDGEWSARLTGELNVYRAADAVITPSAKEHDLLAAFLGEEAIHELPLAKPVPRARVPFEERSGLLFTGNFRHLPNGEAVEHLCRDVLPLVDGELRAGHPLTVIGSRLGDKVRAHAHGVDHVRMVGWVPSPLPYLAAARVSVAPLLHGAGIKGKIVESLMAGTPVVTTPIGAEGLGLRDGTHALIADGAAQTAAAIERLLTDGALWRRLADAGARLGHERHGTGPLGERFLEIVDRVLEQGARAQGPTPAEERARRHQRAYAAAVRAAVERIACATEPGSTTLVVSRGDEALVRIAGRRARHFPLDDDGQWAGHHPADGEDAVRRLQAQVAAGARYLAIPSGDFWWLQHYGALARHLEASAVRVAASEHAVVFDLAPAGGARAGSNGAGREPAVADAADWDLQVADGVRLPEGWADAFLAHGPGLAAAGVQRMQPAHDRGPDAGLPVLERQLGVAARELPSVTPMPVLAVRRGAASTGPTAIVDACPLPLDELPAAAEDPAGYGTAGDVLVQDGNGLRRAVQRSHGFAVPLISVLIATRDRPELLQGCLEGFCAQTLTAADFEVVVVDDGSEGEATAAVLEAFAPRLPLTWVRIAPSGRSAAKNLALTLARAEVVVWFDDDDVPAPDMLAAHAEAHARHPGEGVAVLGHTAWAPELEVTPVMSFLVDVDKLLFAYGHLEPGARYDWRCFWEGRISSKRALHLRHGLHDQRLGYSIDVEMAWRLAPHGLQVVYEPAARSVMARDVDVDAFCRRCEGKGRAQALIARLHPDPEIERYTGVDGAHERWAQAEGGVAGLRARAAELEAAVAGGDAGALGDLHRCYRELFAAFTAKGVAEGLREGEAEAEPPPKVPRARRPRRPAARAGDDGRPPLLTVTMPIWNRTQAVADLSRRMVDRVWEVARLPTEVVVVDNGSPVQVPFHARMHRFPTNRGIATAWNTGIELARAPVVAVLNSDCQVEPGWDEALFEAATTGRRIAFPYTDHVDGEGFRAPDQAGTAGWCFVLSREVIDEVGPFDEMFNPAFCEDTDYWHRAWKLGVELSPVPDARVIHARRTSASAHADWLLTSHRYLYGWKHGVEPMRAPPFYNRKIVEYECQGLASSATTT